MEQKSPLKHIAIIMDGNRRWARQHKLAALQGHEFVANKVIEPLVDHAIKLGIPYLTMWAFSTENWRRDQEEVTGLMNLFRQAFTRSAAKLHEKGVRLHMIGDISRFPADLQMSIVEWMKMTEKNARITVTFALNYGGRDEILRAAGELVEKAQANGGLHLQNGYVWDEEHFSGALDTATVPDPDLIIRPGGEKRLSGFMPWQSVYSELYFTDVLMPDFSPAELDKAIEDYTQRQRRFGT